MKTIKDDKLYEFNLKKMSFIADCFVRLGVDVGFLKDDKNEKNCIPAYRIISEDRTIGIPSETTKNKRTAFYVAAAEAVQFLYGQGFINKVDADNYNKLLKEFYNTNRTYA